MYILILIAEKDLREGPFFMYCYENKLFMTDIFLFFSRLCHADFLHFDLNLA